MIDFPKAVSLLALIGELWPNVLLYDKQREIVESVERDDETYVPAANMMGKDFVAAYIVLAFFLSRNPCRIVTTSVKDGHLDVLWGEISRAIDTCKYPLSHKEGGPLVILQRKITKVVEGQICGISYIKGMVADDMNAMQGHHVAKTGDGIPRTCFMVDEAAGVKNGYYDMAATWADCMLIFGNCNPCNNFFFKGVKKGPVRAPDNKHFYSNVIRIKAEDSPNVQLALAQETAGKKITSEMLIPGVLGIGDYRKRRDTWNELRQCIGLDAEFYEGAELLLYPPDWLNFAERLALTLPGKPLRVTMGVDSAMGGDNTAWAVLSDWGLLDLISIKTPDTTVITGKTLALMRQYNIQDKNVLFDAGGGGKVHVDRLRQQGHRKIQLIAFGAAASPEKKRSLSTLEHRKEDDVIRYIYKNRRAEMYGLLSRKLDPNDGGGIAIPAKYEELRRQLAPIPRLEDGEGRLYLPPKHRKDPNSEEETLTEILGCSPDEADAVVLANFGMDKKSQKVKVGAI